MHRQEDALCAIDPHAAERAVDGVRGESAAQRLGTLVAHANVPAWQQDGVDRGVHAQHALSVRDAGTSRTLITQLCLRKRELGLEGHELIGQVGDFFSGLHGW